MDRFVIPPSPPATFIKKTILYSFLMQTKHSFLCNLLLFEIVVLIKGIKNSNVGKN